LAAIHQRKDKKGLLYSKAEKYGLSEIEYLEDENGQVYDLSKLSKAPSRNSQKSAALNTLYFQTGDLIKEETKAPEPAKNEEEVLENSLSLLNTSIKKDFEPAAPIEEKSDFEKDADYEEQTAPVLPVEVENSTAVAATPTKAESNYNQIIIPAKSSVKPVSSQSALLKSRPEAGALAKSRSAQNKRGTSDTKQLRILQYQIVILFSVAIVAIGLLFLLTMIGMRGSAYGKHSLFPTRLVQMNGLYGVIDQGTIA